MPQIFCITPTLASFDTYDGSVKSVKSVQMMSLRRWLYEVVWVVGWVQGGGVKVSKVSPIILITPTIDSFDTYEGSVKSVKSVQIVGLRK